MKNVVTHWVMINLNDSSTDNMTESQQSYAIFIAKLINSPSSSRHDIVWG